jgi:23S rRNA (uracil1939-C5)-methyltransferase
MIDNRLKKERFRNDRTVKGSDNGKIEGKKGKAGGSRNNSKTDNRNGSKNGGRNDSSVGSWNSSRNDSDIGSRAGGRNGSNIGSRTDSRNDSKTGGWNDSKTGGRNDSKTGGRNDSKAGGRNDSKAGRWNDSKTGGRNDSKAGRWNDSKTGGRNDSKAGRWNDSKTGSRNDSKTSGRNDSKAGGLNDTKTGGWNENKTGRRNDSKTSSGNDSWTVSRNDSRTDGRNDSKTGRRNDSKTGNRNDSKTGDWNDSKTSGWNDRKTVSRNDSKAGGWNDSKAGGRNDSKAGGRNVSKTGGRNDSKTGGRNDSKTGRRNDSKIVSRTDSKTDSRTDSRNGQSGNMPNKASRGERKSSSKCPVSRDCGGCQLLDMPYEKQLEQKQKYLEKLLKPYCRIAPIIGMENPYHYRNKVHAVFDHDKKGNPISGVYEANSHRVVPVESCMIEDKKADEIIGTIRGMLKSFKIRTYDEDTGYGLLRHVLIRRGFATGEIMVVLVTASPVFPSKNNFVKALREKHPEITTIIQNINGRETSMVLGDKEHVLFGKGYIEDILCGCRFHISSKSFYQVNPVQTEVLYNKAIEAAGLTGKERVIDAYCGIGTIGIVASKYAKEVIGVEINREAVRDAVENAKINGIKNARFFCNDAGKFMVNMAENGEHVDVVFMDPPRSGSTDEFIDSVAKVRPERIIYVSCGPETLARDLGYFRKKGYEAKMGWGVDLFPATEHVEVITLLQKA